MSVCRLFLGKRGCCKKRGMASHPTKYGIEEGDCAAGTSSRCANILRCVWVITFVYFKEEEQNGCDAL